MIHNWRDMNEEDGVGCWFPRRDALLYDSVGAIQDERVTSFDGSGVSRKDGYRRFDVRLVRSKQFQYEAQLLIVVSDLWQSRPVDGDVHEQHDVQILR